MTEWQPIETAPSEGDFLAYVPNSIAGPILIVEADMGEFWHMAGDDTETVKPTHWMPLPPPPSTKEPKR